MTMQHDDDSASRHRYADARPQDYSPDFQDDGSGGHPVKPSDDDSVDEQGIPAVAETRRPQERDGAGPDSGSNSGSGSSS